MTIKSYVGNHPIRIYAGCVYDPTIRKYRGGRVIAEIPYSGRMLSASVAQSEDEGVPFGKAIIPTMTQQVFTGVDEIPPVEECDLCVVSALYVAACRSLGRDTSRLLTIGGVVVDEEGRTVGAVNLNRN